MSAILSADALNDFITPGVACIKPVETLPSQQPPAKDSSDPYEVTTEDKVAQQQAANAPPAQISLTDCLACSGCVTSAEAVLVSLQSHEEVLTTLDGHKSLSVEEAELSSGQDDSGRIFIASVSPQARASLAVTYGVSERDAGYMIEQLLCGPKGVRTGGKHNSGFNWVVDTNPMREACHAAGVAEVLSTMPSSVNGQAHDRQKPKTPILASSCPGWICYAEKTHPHILPHLSHLKSPQALTGTLVKSVLARRFGVAPDRIWHLAVMPCFDKKLEASREELTDGYWRPDAPSKRGVRDVDCVITGRELLMLAESRGVSFPSLPRAPVHTPPFPDASCAAFLFPHGTSNSRRRPRRQAPDAGTSGGYAHAIIRALQTQHPGSTLHITRGRNADVIEYELRSGTTDAPLAKTARYYGFRNIQNLVRRLKPARATRLPGSSRPARGPAAGGGPAMAEYAFVEVMACPGGCTNGGGQIKAADMPGAAEGRKPGPAEQKEWLGRVDEAYYSAESEEEQEDAMEVDGDGGADDDVQAFLEHWAEITGIALDTLLYTSYRQVESDVGKKDGGNDMERVAGLASSIGGGW